MVDSPFREVDEYEQSHKTLMENQGGYLRIVLWLSAGLGETFRHTRIPSLDDPAGQAGAVKGIAAPVRFIL